MPAFWVRRFEPVDNAGLVLFRALFGALMVCECLGAIATGWVFESFIEPAVQFPMIGFEWLPTIRSNVAYAYYGTMAILAGFVAAGLHFRPALFLFALLWTGTYLMQTAHYNNHYYLIVLLSILLLSTPADADFSLMARRHPGRRTNTCARWCYEILIAQTAILYAFAAYAKLQPDWMAGRPFDVWLEGLSRTREMTWLYGQPWLKWVLAWGGFAFDATVVPALLWARTRPFAVAAALGFHLFNSAVFRVGVFPYLGLALLVLFFPPSVWRHMLPAAKHRASGVALDGWTAQRRVGILMFACYFALQIALPLRHHLYPGSVDWNEEGHRMSWRMMLRSKRGRVLYYVEDRVSGHTWEINPAPMLTPHQRLSVPSRPDMIWQFARHLKAIFQERGYPDVAVYADSRVSLNGRPRAPLIDPTVDLASTPWNFFSYNSWITPNPQSDYD
jgi:vitamin K-dependent gamma-carboxylase